MVQNDFWVKLVHFQVSDQPDFEPSCPHDAQYYTYELLKASQR